MSRSEPVEHRFRGAVELCFFEWRADLAGAEPTIFLNHATGFHARVFDPVIARIPDRHIISLDQRGHGRSEKGVIEHWRDVGEDLAALVNQLELRDAIGVGHSMGGHAITQAAAACPGAFQRLLLIDPVIASPGDYQGGGWSLPAGENHPTVKRKNHFASPEEMIERFTDRRPYSLFQPEALRAYCEYGLLPAPDGDGFVLACPPEVEASVYMTSRTHPEIYDSIRALEIPVVILRARTAERGGVMDFTTSPTWPELAKQFRNGTDVYLPELTHFIPMQDPELTAKYVLGTLP